MAKFYYFGCYDDVGHHMYEYDSSSGKNYELMESNPWKYNIV